VSEFANITVLKKANIYFNGAVTSRTVIFPDGSKKTLGIMQPGEYTFTTGVGEIMEIIDGDLAYRVGDSGEWKKISGGQSFEVPGNSSFIMKVSVVTDYCCSFLGN
jgi:uncharacterized protein YaiE (UPF0345 family)